MDYTLVILATVLLAFDFAISKSFQSKEGVCLSSGLKFNAVNGLFTALIFFALSGFKIEFSLFSIILAFLMALFAMTYSIIGFRILREGDMSIYSLFLMSGGMLLPYLFGVLFLNEELNALRIIGLLIILFAVIISNRSKAKLPASVYLLCIAIFILNGFVSIFSKCHQIGLEFSPVSSSAFVMYAGLWKFVLSMIALLFCKDKKMSFADKKSCIITICSALIGGVSYLLQLIGAKTLPASALYPIVTGGNIVFSTLAGKIFFKEKLSTQQIISVALCFVGTLLFL